MRGAIFVDTVLFFCYDESVLLKVNFYAYYCFRFVGLRSYHEFSG